MKNVLTRSAELLALISLVVSITSLYVSYDSAKSTNRIATQAMEISNQANNIALGVVREPALLEFPSIYSEPQEFNFTSIDFIQKNLSQIIHLKNEGKRGIEGATIELVGVEPLTYAMQAPSKDIRPLPSIVTSLTFNSAIQPGGSASVDFRKPILEYLSKLSGQISNRDQLYSTSINVVVTPRAMGDLAPIGAPLKQSPRDRELITVKFKIGVVDSAVAKQILSSPSLPNRVFSP